MLVNCLYCLESKGKKELAVLIHKWVCQQERRYSALTFSGMLLTAQLMPCFASFRAHLGWYENMPFCSRDHLYLWEGGWGVAWERKPWHWESRFSFIKLMPRPPLSLTLFLPLVTKQGFCLFLIFALWNKSFPQNFIFGRKTKVEYECEH